MGKEKIVLIIGAVLISLRLIFPVLQCNYSEDDVGSGVYEKYCPNQSVYFFSLTPQKNYQLHLNRTYMQAFVIALLTGTLYFVLKPKATKRD
jgi:hypothetical protein